MRTKIVSLSTYSLAALWAFHKKGKIDPLLAVLVLISALLIDMGTTAFNTFFDYYNGTDHKELNREKDKVLVHEEVVPGMAFIIGAVLFLLAAGLGFFIGIIAGWPVIFAGALCMAVGFFYTGGPYPISRTPLGELFAGGFLGSVFFLLVTFILTRQINADSIFVSLPSTILIASILTVNNTCDIKGDREAGRTTLSILLGPRLSKALIILQGIAVWSLCGGMVFLKLFPVTALIPFALGAILTLPVYRGMFRRGFRHETKGPSMGGISQIFMIFTLTMIAAILLNFWR
jgi:1,4-dihydroxy-2-naphthoate octaprenyltransferase